MSATEMRTMDLTAAILLIVAVAYVPFSKQQYETITHAEQRLAHSGIVSGTPETRVIAILDSLNIEHAFVGRDRVLGAYLGPSFRDAMIEGNIHAAFRFDGKRTLRSTKLDERYTPLIEATAFF